MDHQVPRPPSVSANQGGQTAGERRMYLAATDHDSVTLVQPYTFTAFHVQRTAGVDLDSAFASSGAGQVAGEHVLVSIEWLRAQSSDPEWSVSLEKMLDYAATQGWTDPKRTWVRAHIE